ncbi:MAG: GIY-YIG nuclease family protein [Egibacteraceae bacterium]
MDADPLPVVIASGEIAVPRPGAAFVYRAYATDGCLLYVGVASDVLARLGEHGRGRSLWASIAVRVTWDEYVNRGEAEEAEARLIRDLNPQYNLSHNWHAPDPACFHPTRDEIAAAEERAERAFQDLIWDA